MYRPVAAADFVAATPVHATDSSTDSDKNTYDQDSVLKDAEHFFGSSTQGLAKIIEKSFKDHGRPNGYIKGEEASVGRSPPFMAAFIVPPLAQLRIVNGCHH